MHSRKFTAIELAKKILLHLKIYINVKELRILDSWIFNNDDKNILYGLKPFTTKAIERTAEELFLAHRYRERQHKKAY